MDEGAKCVSPNAGNGPRAFGEIVRDETQQKLGKYKRTAEIV
jgi:hypothetical protein